MDSRVTADTLRTLLAAYEGDSKDSAFSHLESFFAHNPRYVLACTAVVLLCIACMILHRKSLATAVAACALLLGFSLLLYLGYQGRVLFRAVDTALLPCAVILCALLLMKPSKPINAKWIYAITATTIALCAVVGMHFYATHQVLSDKMDTVSLQREAELEAYALAHPEKLIVRSPNLLRDTRIFPNVEEGIAQNILIWGDWYCKTPTWYGQFEKVGIDGQTFTSSDWLSSPLLFVTADETPPQALLDSIQNQTQTTVTATHVDSYGTLRFFAFE